MKNIFYFSCLIKQIFYFLETYKYELKTILNYTAKGFVLYYIKQLACLSFLSEVI